MMRLLVTIFWTCLGVVMLGYLAVYVMSEMALRDFPPPSPFAHPIPTDAQSIERGRHIARTRGCFGCHGQQLQGWVFTDQWDWVDRAVAPNLAAHAKVHDTNTLEAAIRDGVGHDGRALYSMPSYNWVRMRDADVADLIAFLRSAPVVHSELPKPNLGLAARWALATGAEDHMAQWATYVPPLRTDLDSTALQHGHYLAMTTCVECHGLDLRGDGFVGTPDLAIIAGYPMESFRRLMQEGISISGRDDMVLMSMIARDRFAAFSEQELTDLHTYLSSLAQEPRPATVFWRHAE